MNKAKRLLVLCIAILFCTGTWAKLKINESTFPDSCFRNWVLSQYGGKDVLNKKDIARLTSVKVDSMGIKDLRGIEYFTTLTMLSCRGNQLTELDVSKNTALKQLDCSMNQIISLDVTGCTELNVLLCFGNRITNIDVSRISMLVELSCSSNALTELDVSNNTVLTLLSCEDNQLKRLDVSMNNALTSLECFENKLTTLNLSNNTSLVNLLCFDNQLTELDVSHNTALTRLDCECNLLTTLVLPKNSTLARLDCFQNQIRGEAMDLLVESLPSVVNGALRVIYYKEEDNLMTKAQVDAAKAKGWIPYAFDSIIGMRIDLLGAYTIGEDYWKEYTGSE